MYNLQLQTEFTRKKRNIAKRGKKRGENKRKRESFAVICKDGWSSCDRGRGGRRQGTVAGGAAAEVAAATTTSPVLTH